MIGKRNHCFEVGSHSKLIVGTVVGGWAVGRHLPDMVWTWEVAIGLNQLLPLGRNYSSALVHQNPGGTGAED